ncbi:hypothetical protein GSH05_02560 [Burkholderia pseudomallei]|uniref:hypothetical protein n=1 Tax=Burkholderia pseudomallei TaxID=28450 RepID=UPI000539000C|nr:hypothetical protein [Burkholderia pseudomallei]KGW25202.1 hypothetical protein Y602_4586 [Burkholderia pseudomallei MSHR733]KGX45422.1 hypothetical protein Y043_5071 [Burkholderia pseudomallei MSHR2138]KGX48006.1 hypothetical protein Y600_6061 [Burkholderia pseudomallei MSHR3709]MBM5650571.1 hypothetical protein [Burkholderia pseudomallei]
MKVEEAADAIAKFFNDLIGAWVPGTVLTVGLALMHLGPVQLQSIFKLGDTTSAALTFAGVLFAIGHALLAFHDQVLKKLLSKVGLAKPFDEAKAKTRKSYEWFAELVKVQQAGAGAKDWSYNDLRSVALSVSAEAASTGRRFMFISLLCNGVGAALAILALDFAACSLLSPKLLFIYADAVPWSAQVLLLLGLALTLFKQGNVFYNRAMATPFSIAIAELKFKKDANAGQSSTTP